MVSSTCMECEKMFTELMSASDGTLNEKKIEESLYLLMFVHAPATTMPMLVPNKPEYNVAECLGKLNPTDLPRFCNNYCICFMRLASHAIILFSMCNFSKLHLNSLPIQISPNFM